MHRCILYIIKVIILLDISFRMIIVLVMIVEVVGGKFVRVEVCIPFMTIVFGGEC